MLVDHPRPAGLLAISSGGAPAVAAETISRLHHSLHKWRDECDSANLTTVLEKSLPAI